MADETRFHVLLIGVDAYGPPTAKLNGCVNDIDAVQRLLLNQVGIEAGSITRLASPHPTTSHETTVPAQPATLKNIREALAKLASDGVKSNDRVFVYYAGHGLRAPVQGAGGIQSFCESLVPVDFDAIPGKLSVLPDFELNQTIANILKRTLSVTLVLDCCHSTGVTRFIPTDEEIKTRALDFDRDLEGFGPIVVEEAERSLGNGIGNVDECQIVAACLNDEKAGETRLNGVVDGLMTSAFVTALSEIKDDLRSVPWSRIWQKMQENVQKGKADQHVWMAGSLARSILAGPPVDGDAGFYVSKSGDQYKVEAGTLADVGVGAKLAVYGEKPALFPALDSPEDIQARVNPALLTVKSADRATAVAISDSTPFELPPGARARLVKPGEAAKFRYAVVGKKSVELEEILKKAPLLQSVSADKAEVRLEWLKDVDKWALTDDLAGTSPEFPYLITFDDDQISHARELLELYTKYALPLRLAKRCLDLPGQVKLSLISCPSGGLTPEDAGKVNLPEIARDKEGGYSLTPDDAFCIQIRNASNRRLRVSLLNCAASGKVEFLDDRIIMPNSYERIWNGSNIGNPFSVSKPEPGQIYIDRLVVIGTTRDTADLRYLKNTKRFSSVFTPTREMGGDDREMSSPTAEQWTATEIKVRVRESQNTGGLTGLIGGRGM